MESSNSNHQNESKGNTAGRSTEKEEATNDSHEANKGPDAPKVDGHNEGGRCKEATHTDKPQKNNGK